MENVKTTILMSTYNGALYLKDQIDSIISQNYHDWLLYIRDDGSQDNTVEIIKEYCKSDSRIRYIKDNKIHRGPKESFLWLLGQVESDFYMFCDQDDVWHPEKINLSYNSIKAVPSDIPALAVTDLELVDVNLKTLQPSMWKTHKIEHLVHHKDGLLIASMFPGCTMFFNKKLRDIALKETFNFPMHDMHISFVAKRNGGIIKPIDIPLIKYRQHSTNVIGLYSGSKLTIHKIKQLRTTVLNNIKYYRMVKSYLQPSFFKYINLKIYHILELL